MKEGFRIGGEGPTPCGSVVVGGFTLGVFFADIDALVGMVGIVYELMMVVDGKGLFNGLIGKTADGTRYK